MSLLNEAAMSFARQFSSEFMRNYYKGLSDSLVKFLEQVRIWAAGNEFGIIGFEPMGELRKIDDVYSFDVKVNYWYGFNGDAHVRIVGQTSFTACFSIPTMPIVNGQSQTPHNPVID